MKDKNKTIVILGASGCIGSYLYKRYKEEKYDVIGSYYKNEKPGLVHFDIQSMDLADILDLKTKKTRYLIITAAANAKLDDSKIYWGEAYKVNVVRTKKIIDTCFKHNIIPIYFSTDNVFDGTKGDYKEDDERKPITSYGKMRFEIENYIISSNMPYMILRMGRVLGFDMDDNTLVTLLLKSLKNNESLVCADDLIFTPIHIEDIFYSINKLIEREFRGAVHLASQSSTNRFEIAKSIESFFNIENANIKPCKIDSLNLVEERPKLIGLNIEKFKKLSGFKEKNIESLLKQIENVR